MEETISPADGAELTRLLAEHVKATLHGAEVLRKHGMESPEFREADKATGAIWARIRELQGLGNKHWMA